MTSTKGVVQTLETWFNPSKDKTLGDIFPPARVLVEEFFGTYIGVAGSRNLVELSRCSQIVDKHILLW